MLGVSEIELIASGLWALSKTFKRIQQATNEIRYFQIETVTLSDLIMLFYEIATKYILCLEPTRQKTKLAIIDGLVKQFSLASQDIKSLATRLVIPYGRTQSAFQRIVIQVRWHVKKDTIAGLRLRLEGIKSAAQLFMTTAMFEDLQWQIADLQRSQQEVPDVMILKM